MGPGPPPKLKGTVLDANFEETVEYVGEVNHPEYTDKLRDGKRLSEAEYVTKWGKRPIRHVSVSGMYRSFKKEGAVTEPHGLVFTALSLVEDPEKPGDPSSSVEVAETLADPSKKIMEMILREKGVDFEERDGEFCLKGEEEKARERWGYSTESWKRLNVDLRRVYMESTPTEEQRQRVREFEEAQHPAIHEAGLNVVHPDGPVVGVVPGQSPVKEPVVSKSPVREALAAEGFKLGEPFADYQSFDQCVVANKDKEDPEGYCAAIMRRTEGGETEKRLALVREAHLKIDAWDERFRELVEVVQNINSRLEKFESKRVAETVEGGLEAENRRLKAEVKELMDTIKGVKPAKPAFKVQAPQPEESGYVATGDKIRAAGRLEREMG